MAATMARLAKLAAGRLLATAGRIEDAREARDEAWRPLRAALLSGADAPPAAAAFAVALDFERLLAEADRLATRPCPTPSVWRSTSSKPRASTLKRAPPRSPMRTKRAPRRDAARSSAIGPSRGAASLSLAACAESDARLDRPPRRRARRARPSRGAHRPRSKRSVATLKPRGRRSRGSRMTSACRRWRGSIWRARPTASSVASTRLPARSRRRARRRPVSLRPARPEAGGNGTRRRPPGSCVLARAGGPRADGGGRCGRRVDRGGGGGARRLGPGAER